MYSLAQLKVLARSIHTATDQVHACRRHATARESCSRSMYRECGAVRARRGVSAPRDVSASQCERGAGAVDVMCSPESAQSPRCVWRERDAARERASAQRRERVSARVPAARERAAARERV